MSCWSVCLTQFHDDEPRKLTLLLYAAVRRVLKRMRALMEDRNGSPQNNNSRSCSSFSEEVS